MSLSYKYSSPTLNYIKNLCAIYSLHQAVENGDINKIKLLLNKGYNINTIDKDGNTPLFYALQIKNPYIVELLVQKGANINAQDNQGKTYLHKTSDWQLVQLLKSLGARSDIKDHFGKTACDYAEEHGNYKLLAILAPNHHILHPDEGSYGAQEELIGADDMFQKLMEPASHL